MVADFNELFPPKAPRKRKAESTLKDAADNAVEKISAIADTPAHNKTTGWAESDIETITAGFALLLLEGTRFLSYRATDSEALKMQEDESEVISKALSKIVLRHIKVPKGKRGDVTDGMMLVVAFTAYGMRSYDTYRRIKREQNQVSGVSAGYGRSNQTIIGNQPGVQTANPSSYGNGSNDATRITG